MSRSRRQKKQRYRVRSMCDCWLCSPEHRARAHRESVEKISRKDAAYLASEAALIRPMIKDIIIEED